MISTANAHTVPLADAERVMEHHLDLVGSRPRRRTVRQFLAGIRDSSQGTAECLILDEARVLQWMIRDAAGRSVRSTRIRLGAVSRFVQSLHRAGLLETDPIAQFRSAFTRQGWDHFVPALQATDPEAALAAMRSPPTRPNPLARPLQDYLAYHRALGKNYDCDRRTLQELDRFLWARGVASVAAVGPAHIEDWFESQPGNWKTRWGKARCVDRFFVHLVDLGLLAASPVPRPLLATRKHVPRVRLPFIFTPQQLTAIFAEARRLPSEGYAPWHTRTCHTMLCLLYALGLRHGEASRLRIRDIDFTRQTLFIDRTKFYKSRCLPFGPKVGCCLQEFLDLRRTILTPVRDDHPLFVAWWRTPVFRSLLGRIFRSILRRLNIVGPHERLPRLHDLRHTFAVHRLLRWYREGVDVQARLPLLATFLGHVDIQSTEVYLTVTDDLLLEANSRFYDNFGRGIDHRYQT